uniref:Secreted protein n=1 Tax=Oryza nivara TaxID=4536 RepID=A0A0E0HWC7_ORYNI
MGPLSLLFLTAMKSMIALLPCSIAGAVCSIILNFDRDTWVAHRKMADASVGPTGRREECGLERIDERRGESLTNRSTLFS